MKQKRVMALILAVLMVFSSSICLYADGGTKAESPLIIGVGETGYFEAGPWPNSQAKGYGDKVSRLTAVKDACAAFHPNIVSPAEVKISAFINNEDEFNRTPDKQAKFEVYHNGKVDTVTIDNSKENGWVELGTYKFAGTGDEYVRVSKATPEMDTFVRINCVKFEADSLTVGDTKAKQPSTIDFAMTGTGDGVLDEDKIYDYDYNYAVYNPGENEIVTSDDEGYQELYGEFLSSNLAGYQGAKSRYSFTPEAVARWNAPKFSGLARVSIFKLQHVNSDTKAKITIAHNGEKETIYIDFTKGSSGWVDMGTYQFSGEGEEYVEMTNSETLGTLRCNAVRFETNVSPVQAEGEVSYVEADPQKLNAVILQASKQSKKPEVPLSAEIALKVSKDRSVFMIPYESIEYAREILPEGVITLKNEHLEAAVPVKAMETGGEALAVTLGLAGQELSAALPGRVSEPYVFHAVTAVQETPLTFKEPVKLKILNTDSTDYENSAMVQYHPESGETSYVPAFIYGTGGIGSKIYAEGKLNGSAVVSVVNNQKEFGDTAGHWANSEIAAAAGKGLLKGRDESNFVPDASITRAEFTALLVRAIGAPEGDGQPFLDVAESMWYTDTVKAAVQAGLFQNLPYQDAFEPDRAITRQEMAVMIYNALSYEEKLKNTQIEDNYYLNQFADGQDIADWARTGAAKCVENEIINGMETEDGISFAPNDLTNRAQAAAMLARYIDVEPYIGPLAEGEWDLVFHDEFDGTELNTDVWQSESGYPSHILSSRWPENIKVEDGMVKLITKKESRGGAEWTTGNIRTKEFTPTYGYFEAKYRYPKSDSAHYNISFWLAKSEGNTEAAYQEIDINEGRMPDMLQLGIHGSRDGKRWGSYTRPLSCEDLREGFHTYSLEWTESELIWYFDGREVRRETHTHANSPSYVYLSTAIMNGADFDILNRDADGTSMDVEYVRVYQRK